MTKFNKSAFSFYAGVFTISGMVMAMQILQSRIFSVTTWYHLSFLVISVAMFGMTLGALHVYNGNEQEQRKNFAALSQKAAFFCGISLFISLLVQLYFPIVYADFLKTSLALPFVTIPIGAPYYFAGIIITLCLTRAPYPTGKTYGIDLLGAGLGCIAALALMETIDTPSAVIFLCGVAGMGSLLFSISDENSYNFPPIKKTVMLALIAVSLMGTALNASIPGGILRPLFIKGKIWTERYDYEEWNSISRVTVHKEKVDDTPFLWGPSPKIPGKYTASYKWLIIDGDAGTPITKFDGKDFSKHSYLEYDVTNLAYHLPGLEKSAVIGIGGGRDALSAKYFGVPDVTAIDVNPVQIKLLSKNPKYTAYSKLSSLPGIEFINSEARSWFRSNAKKFDLIQMSLIDTWAATGAGAFALSENGLYTQQAWLIFIDSLSEKGVFTVSRWSAGFQNDTARLLSLAVSALIERQAENPGDHIVLSTSGNIVNLIVSKNPLTSEQIDVLHETAQRDGFNILVSPRVLNPESLEAQLIRASSMDELQKISDLQEFDISPSTDMRPFFFNQARFSKPLDVIRKSFFEQNTTSGIFLGQVKATFNLFVIIIFSMLMVAFVILRPLSRHIGTTPKIYLAAGSMYFLLIGLDFMLVEISLLQALGVFLGHPVYGLGVVLFSLIIFAGTGSLISERFPLQSTATRILWCAATCAYVVTLSIFLDDIFTMYAKTYLPSRVALSVLLILPAGLLMGYGFPTGIKMAHAIDTRATSWFWGINGAAGVLGISIAIALNIGIGIDKTLILGGVCYALLPISMMMLTKEK